MEYIKVVIYMGKYEDLMSSIISFLVNNRNTHIINTSYSAITKFFTTFDCHLQ